jgi:tyrosyl-tRNA synthetase
VNRLLVDDFVHLVRDLFLISNSVQSRLECQQGISFTEFSYQLLQAYDFYMLFEQEGCAVQVGGSDQWGNIVAGVELIAHLENLAAGTDNTPDSPKGYGLTTPLLVNSQGQKMGKTEGNAVWLDPHMTSPFEFYQVSSFPSYFLSKTQQKRFPAVFPEGLR